MKRYLKVVIIALVTFGVLSLTTLIIVDQVVMPMYTRHGQEVKVPDVRGMSVSKANVTLVKHGLVPVIKGYKTYPAPPQTVVEQYPLPGKIVKVGRKVELTLAE